MDEPLLLRFANGGSALSLTFEGRPFPDSGDAWDRDAIDANVTVDAKPFFGEFETSVWSHELARLRSTLMEMEQHVGEPVSREFELREATVRMVLETDSVGAMTIRVTARASTGSGAHLLFDIFADQSHIPLWLTALDRVLAVFPPQL